MAIKKIVVCELCEAEVVMKHNMDEDYYEIEYCPFCGENVSEEDGNILDYEDTIS
jgi:Zn-finger nucleic acid-binding protein|tara:strand:+ start:226 stop:390 length:165 start_codon:yes stop_codon:yes gene_type:complete